MRGGPSAVDFRDLEAAFARLSIRLEAAEARIALLEDQRNQARDYRSESPSGFSVVTAPPQRQAATSPQQVRTPAQEHPLQASAQPSAAPRERQELADHLGDWLRRELDGRGGGVSGRDRLGLRSRLYVLVQNHRGDRFDPVQVQSRLCDLRAHFRNQQDPGAAILLGFVQLGRQGERWLGPT